VCVSVNVCASVHYIILYWERHCTHVFVFVTEGVVFGCVCVCVCVCVYTESGSRAIVARDVTNILPPTFNVRILVVALNICVCVCVCVCV